MHLLGSKASKTVLFNWNIKSFSLIFAEGKKHIQFPLTDVSCWIFFHRHCCQFCFPCFHGQYYVTIRHLAAAQNYLLGNLLKHWVSGWGEILVHIWVGSLKFEERCPNSQWQMQMQRQRQTLVHIWAGSLNINCVKSQNSNGTQNEHRQYTKW